MTEPTVHIDQECAGIEKDSNNKEEDTDDYDNNDDKAEQRNSATSADDGNVGDEHRATDGELIENGSVQRDKEDADDRSWL